MPGLALAVVATYNYLHAVLNLVRSIRRTWSVQPTIYVGLVDHAERERPGFESVGGVEFVPATSLGVQDFWWQAAKFSPADFCCVLKPYLLRHVLARGHDTVVYCDADMQFFDDGSPLIAYAPQADFVLIPHMTSSFPAGFPDERPTIADTGNAGMMNGGLFVVRRRPAALSFLDQWSELCTAPGTFLPEYGNPSEQQALNWVFSYVDDVAVFRDPRFNIAYWNLHERPLRWRALDGGPEDEWTLGDRSIVCFHFSGLSWPDGRLSRHENRHHLSLNVNLWALCRHYHRSLVAAPAAHYTAAAYEHGEVEGHRLSAEVRQELRRLEGFAPPVVESWADVPGALRGAAHLIGRQSIMPMYLERILDGRGDLQRLDDPARGYRLGFLEWATRWLRYEHACGALLEYYTDTVFQLHDVDRLAADIARGPAGLSPEAATRALLTDRPALLARLRRDYPRADLLEAIEGGGYRYPAYDPALCVRFIYERRRDLQEAFPDPLGSDLEAFRRWLRVSMPLEYVLPERVRTFSSTLDPTASLARLLGRIQLSDAWRKEIMTRGLEAWAVP